jgi:PAS domain S-box-containing protein
MSKGRILVVAGNVSTAKEIVRLVTKMGYEVPATSQTSVETVKKASQLLPDIILMDIKLNSQKDGIETADTIRKKHGIPSVYFTANTDNETVERAMKTHPYGYIVKPFKEKELEIALELAFLRLNADKALSAQQKSFESECFNFMTILDKFPEFLYVSDPNTYEILFACNALRRLLKTDIKGKKCYEVFQGRSEPCKFCTNDIILKTRQPHVWDNFNPHLGRHFLNTDQIIKWPDGRDVRFETAIDITDQKKIERMLNASEDKYKSLIEQSSYGFFIMNNNHEIIYFNRIAREIYGVDAGSNIKIKLSDILTPEDQARAIRNLKTISRVGQLAEPSLYKVTLPDGQIRHIQIQAFPIWKDKEIDGYHGTVMDITVRMEYETKLKENSDFLNAVIKNTSEGMFVIDDDFNYVLINPASGKILGHNPEEWIGKRAGSNKHPDDEAKGLETIMQVFTEGSSNVEIRVKSSDGKYHLLYIRYTLMKLNNKDHILGMVTDITETRKAEIALKESEEKYRNLFEDSPESIMLLDSEYNIMECNSASLGLFGKNRDAIIGKSLADICTMDESEKEYFNGAIESVINGSRIEKLELEIAMKNGSELWIETFPTLIKKDDLFYAVQIITRNITDRKSMEKEVRRRLLRFNLEDGKMYLTKELQLKTSLEAFKELLLVGYSGAFLSRSQKRDYAKKMNLAYMHISLSEKESPNTILPEPRLIFDTISTLPRRSVLMIDCIEYLVSRIGEKKTLNLIQGIKDIATQRNIIVLLSMDPTAITEKAMRLVEKETQEILHSESLQKISDKLLDVINFIDSTNKEQTRPTYSQIGEELAMSKPTVRARIKQLVKLGIVVEKPHGRMKMLELTDKGKQYLAP